MAGDADEDEYPIGFRFKPKDEELVEYYLVNRLTRQPTVPNDYITEYDVYLCHPDTLTKGREFICSCRCGWLFGWAAQMLSFCFAYLNLNSMGINCGDHRMALGQQSTRAWTRRSGTSCRRGLACTATA